MSVYLSVCLYLSICLSIYPPTYPPTYLPTYPSIHLFIQLSVYLFIGPSIYRERQIVPMQWWWWWWWWWWWGRAVLHAASPLNIRVCDQAPVYLSNKAKCFENSFVFLSPQSTKLQGILGALPVHVYVIKIPTRIHMGIKIVTEKLEGIFAV